MVCHGLLTRDNPPMPRIFARAALCSSSLLVTPALACGPGQQAQTETSSASETGDTSGSETETGGPSEQACADLSPAGLADCVDQDRYLADLEFIAQPREPGSAHWQAVQDLCAERFAAHGFEVDLHTYATGVNVIGRKIGTQTPDEHILIAAHYDHIPGCNGADDNATGVAAVLESARILSQVETPRTLLVACWDEEESGLIGAEAYAGVVSDTGQDLLFNYNFEMIGFRDDAPNSQTVPDGFDLLFPQQVAELEANEYRGDFLAIIVDDDGLPFTGSIATYAEARGVEVLTMPVPSDLKNSPLLADLRRSDHAAFWAIDVPAVMLTDTSNFRYANYHCGAGEDAVELLDHEFAAGVIAGTVGAAAEALGL